MQKPLGSKCLTQTKKGFLLILNIETHSTSVEL
jgi:hypothetical protein